MMLIEAIQLICLVSCNGRGGSASGGAGELPANGHDGAGGGAAWIVFVFVHLNCFQRSNHNLLSSFFPSFG